NIRRFNLIANRGKLINKKLLVINTKKRIVDPKSNCYPFFCVFTARKGAVTSIWSAFQIKSKSIVCLLGYKRPLEKCTFHLSDFPSLITSFFVFLLFLFGCACRRTVIACVVFVRVKGKVHS